MSGSAMWWEGLAREAFGFLEARYGFSAPESEQIGREYFVRFRKANRWVSIAVEPGTSPIVEFFYPSRDMKHRRIPKLSTASIRPPNAGAIDEAWLRTSLIAQAAELEALERAFLSGDGDA